MPGDPNHCGAWLGPRWRLDWCWWRVARGASTVCLDRKGRPKETLVQRGNRDWLSAPLPETSLVVFRDRCYRWKGQLLSISFSELEPSDSLAAERLFASVRFEPKGRWR